MKLREDDMAERGYSGRIARGCWWDLVMAAASHDVKCGGKLSGC